MTDSDFENLPNSQDDTVEKIGRKIRDIRKSNDLTLKGLSERTNISVSMLSKIEKAQTSPPISTYSNIAKALKIELGDLFSNAAQESDLSIVRSDERLVVSRGAYLGSPLAFKRGNKKMEPFVFEYPIEKDFPDFLRHDSEEMIYVIEGEIEFKYGDEVTILKEGDCAYFNGNKPHGGRALNDRKAVAIVIQSNM